MDRGFFEDKIAQQAGTEGGRRTLREQRENLLADVVAVEDFDARDLAIHNVENQISGLGIQFHVLVPAAPPAMRWSSSVDGRTKVVAASTAIDETKL